MTLPAEPFNPVIDRYDRRRTARLLKSFWPDPAVFRGVAENLAASVRVAHNAADGCWCVTMHPQYLRLNAGQVETLTLHSEYARFLYQSPLSSELQQRFEVSDSDKPYYPSVPVPSGCCVVPWAALKTVPVELRDAHEAYIRAAASFKRVSPFKRSFSPAALECVEEVIGLPLPRPSYIADEEIGLRVEPLPDEVDPSLPMIEGARYEVLVNAYERNPKARSRCIAHYGAKCVICQFDFTMFYGDVADGYIHVHHIKPLSEIGKAYEVDPIEDLRPVCANCHAVVHLGKRIRSVEEVRCLITAARSTT